jgi:FAD/FMN-containing dehydrogenase
MGEMLEATPVGKDEPMTTTPAAGLTGTLAARLEGVVGPAHVLVEPQLRAPFETDWTRRYRGDASVVVRPGTTDEVAGVVRACAEQRVGIVVQGGNTGLVGGAVPGAAGAAAADPVVLLSTVRLTRLDAVDTVAAQMTAGAGVPLVRVQEAATQVGLAFPIDLAARDSATIGGLVATNAGGVHVMRYGPMRAQVVGAEAVLANGSVVSRLSGLVKDNTGYDLSQLLVGSEGTLGIVTAVRLRLSAAHAETVVALVGVDSTSEALAVLDVLRRRVEGLQAAELFFDDGLALVREDAGLPAPLSQTFPAYLLVESAGAVDDSDALYEVLAELDLPDAATAVAADPSGRARLWAYRERHTEAVSALGVPHKLDVTLPHRRLAEFEAAVRQVVADTAPGSTVVLFGHAGDGNLHVNVVGPSPEDDAVDEAVLRLVVQLEGSISAEHGIGRAKARWLALSRSPAELAAMRALKAALDPDGILNPGVLFDPATQI